MKGFLKKCGLFVALFAVLSTVLFPVSSVSAATPYDNVVKLTDNLQMSVQTKSADHTLDWYAQAKTMLETDCSRGSGGWNQSCTLLGRFENLLNGNWMVVANDIRHTDAPGTWVYGYTIYWTESTAGQCEFTYLTTIPTMRCFDNTINRVTVALNADGNIYPQRSTPISNSQYYFSGETVSFFLSTFPTTYPAGYQGQEIPDTVTPTTTLKFAPDWQATKYKDFKVDFADNNFFTIDNNPFLCGEDGFAPIIEYTIVRDDNGQLIDEGQFSASSNLSYQFEKVPERRDYTITGTYTECEGANFTESSSFTFMFNEAGSQHLINWAEECVNTEFPFFHIQSCMYWFENLINTFSFGTISFSNDWTFQPQCRNLTTIGSWFKADSINVCPQVPTYVRNVVTPFVTFALGLLTIKFIATRSSDDYGSMK